MATILDLPNEVLEKIAFFAHQDAGPEKSPQQTMANLELTTRLFAPVAVKFLYKTAVVSENHIPDFLRNILIFKGVARNVTMLDLNLEDRYETSEFPKMMNVTELVLRVNTKVFFEDTLQYKRLPKFLEAFPSLRALTLRITNTECPSSHLYCLRDAHFCLYRYDDWNQTVLQEDFTIVSLFSKLQGVSSTLEHLEVQLYHNWTSERFGDPYVHWVSHVGDAVQKPAFTLQAFAKLKTLVIPGIFLPGMADTNPLKTAEAVLPPAIERLDIIQPGHGLWPWLRAMLDAKEQSSSFSKLTTVNLIMRPCWKGYSQQVHLILDCTQQELDESGIVLDYLPVTHDIQKRIG